MEGAISNCAGKIDKTVATPGWSPYLKSLLSWGGIRGGNEAEPIDSASPFPKQVIT